MSATENQKGGIRPYTVQAEVGGKPYMRRTYVAKSDIGAEKIGINAIEEFRTKRFAKTGMVAKMVVYIIYRWDDPRDVIARGVNVYGGAD